MIKIAAFLSSDELQSVKNELDGRRITYFVLNRGHADNYNDPYYQISVDAIHFLVVKKIVARTLAKSFVENQKCPKCKTLSYKLIEMKTWWERIYYFGTTRVICKKCKTKYVI